MPAGRRTVRSNAEKVDFREGLPFRRSAVAREVLPPRGSVAPHMRAWSLNAHSSLHTRTYPWSSRSYSPSPLSLWPRRSFAYNANEQRPGKTNNYNTQLFCIGFFGSFVSHRGFDKAREKREKYHIAKHIIICTVMKKIITICRVLTHLEIGKNREKNENFVLPGKIEKRPGIFFWLREFFGALFHFYIYKF